MAEQLERRTKPAGGRNGVLGYIGLTVLRTLLLRFHRAPDGMCAPSYVELMAATGLCKQSIANALKRLAAAGILRITRRLVRDVIAGVMACRQGSNLYAVFAPDEHAERLPVRARPFPCAKFGRLAKMLGWKPASLRSRGNPTLGFQYKSRQGEVSTSLS
jgi:hypothetical protein